MTQEQIVYMKSQNWYPAFAYNRTRFDFYHNISDCVGRSFTWCMSPQGAAYWQSVYINLLY